MFFDPQYEILIASQKLQSSRNEMAAYRAGREATTSSRALIALDNALLFASRGAARRQAERTASITSNPGGDTPLAA